MSLVHLAALCSHLTNSSKARLGITSVPSTNLHLRLLLALQASGFLSSVIRGGPLPPPAHLLLSTPSPQVLATLSSRVTPGTSDAEDADTDTLAPVTRENIASRRLWLGLKYWNNEPVLSKMTVESKPTRRIWMDVNGLRDIVRGKKSGYVEGLRSPGECLYLSTDRGVLEARECVERKIGGQILCRAI